MFMGVAPAPLPCCSLAQGAPERAPASRPSELPADSSWPSGGRLLLEHSGGRGGRGGGLVPPPPPLEATADAPSRGRRRHGLRAHAERKGPLAPPGARSNRAPAAARLHHTQRPSGSDLRLCVARKSGHGTAPHLLRSPAATGERLRQQGTGASPRLRLRRPDDLRTARTVNLRESDKIDKTLMGDDFGGRAAMYFTCISCTFGHFSCEIGVRFCGTKTSMTVTRLVCVS